MREEIRERIEMIQKSEVPEGYKSTPIGIIPKDWKVVKIKKCVYESKKMSNDIDNFSVYSSTRNGLLLQSEYFDKDQAVTTNLGYKVVENGFITYRHMSDDDIFHFNQNITGESILVSSEYPVFSTNDFANIQLLLETLNESERFKKFCKIQKLGGTRTRLYFRKLCEYRIGLPDIEEQNKIAKIISNYNKHIELEEKLIEKKVKQMEWLMQNLLDERKRLKGFKDEWKCKKLKDICNIKKGQQLNNDELFQQGKYYMLNGGSAPSGYTNNWNTIENSISISEGGNSCGFVNFNKDKFWSGGHCYTIDGIDKEIDVRFLYYQLKNNEKKIKDLRVGSGLPNIQKKSLESFKIKYPQIMEQKAIEHILFQADKEIELLRQRVEQRKLEKKAMLQLIFSGIIRVK